MTQSGMVQDLAILFWCLANHPLAWVLFHYYLFQTIAPLVPAKILYLLDQHIRVLQSKKKKDTELFTPEAHLELIRTSTVQLFCKNS